MHNYNQTGIIQLLNLKNHDRVSPLLKTFILIMVLFFTGMVFNEKMTMFGAGFIVFIYVLIIATWIGKGIR